jgi:sugar lactone lactonase YvrE
MDCPNVAAFGPDGALYVTCSGEDDRPEILRVAPGGGAVERWTDAVPRYPNGALVTPDGNALVVVEAHAQRVVRVPILAGGGAGEPETIAELPETDPDGIALDAEGRYWVTLYRPDGLVRFAPGGPVEVVVDDRLASTFDAPTNIAWVGAELDRAVVANVGDRVLSIADVGVAGCPLHAPVFD